VQIQRVPVLLFTVILAGAAGCERPIPLHAGGRMPPGWYSQSRLMYHGIPVIVRFSPRDDELAGRVWKYLESVDDVFNDYRDDSEVGRLNNAADRTGVEVSSDFAAALSTALEAHRTTGGAFNVAIGPLRDLWKRAAKSGQRPTPAEVATLLPSCDVSNVKLEGTDLTVAAPGLRFDFGGIVKGIAVDRVTKMLREAGRTAALIQIGGETAAWGISPRGKPHVIGVQHPIDLNALWTAVVDPGTGLSCATSGNYRQPVIIDGTTYYHIIDPNTGRPVDVHTLSVSVAFRGTGNNALADALTTAGAVMGPERLLPLATELGAEALIIVATETGPVEHATEGWHALVRTETR
jgi:thiamine biosynthesis lipoprotein